MSNSDQIEKKNIGKYITIFTVSFLVSCVCSLFLLPSILEIPQKPELLKPISPTYVPSPQKQPKPYIIYIHGWNPLEESHGDEIRKLEAIFPGSPVEVFEWQTGGLSSSGFNKSVAKADGEVADKLADKLNELPEDVRRNTVLIGHSLGGRIAIKAMARLAHPIRCAYFLGTALPDNDGDIPLAMKNTLEVSHNIYNRSDAVLNFFYKVMKLPSGVGVLGGQKYLNLAVKNFLQYENVDAVPEVLLKFKECDNIISLLWAYLEEFWESIQVHYVHYYMDFLEKVVKKKVFHDAVKLKS